MTKALFTGITGLLGNYFLEKKKEKYFISGTYSNNKVNYKGVDLINLNVKEKVKVSELITRLKPQVVVQAASIGNVDYCENYPEEAHAVNVVGTRNVLEACREVGAKIIFIADTSDQKVIEEIHKMMKGSYLCAAGFFKLNE